MNARRPLALTATTLAAALMLSGCVAGEGSADTAAAAPDAEGAAAEAADWSDDQLTVDFATYLTAIGMGEVKGLFRHGWQMDYPSIENFLVPIYAEGASSNYVGYANPEFEQLTRAAASAASIEEANALYQEAERLLAQDMRSIPLWFSTGRAGWSEKVDGVALDAFGGPDFAAITVSK